MEPTFWNSFPAVHIGLSIHICPPASCSELMGDDDDGTLFVLKMAYKWTERRRKELNHTNWTPKCPPLAAASAAGSTTFNFDFAAWLLPKRIMHIQSQQLLAFGGASKNIPMTNDVREKSESTQRGREMVISWPLSECVCQPFPVWYWRHYGDVLRDLRPLKRSIILYISRFKRPLSCNIYLALRIFILPIFRVPLHCSYVCCQ